VATTIIINYTLSNCYFIIVPGARLPPERVLAEEFSISRPTITDDEIVLLEQTLIEMQVGHPEKANEDFHKIISNATRNKAMKIAVEIAVENFWQLRETIDTIKEAYGDVCYNDSVARLKEHQMILDALKSRSAAMHAHFNRLINALFEASEKRALEEVRSKVDQTRGLYSLENIR